jgi:hypothetical protein
VAAARIEAGHDEHHERIAAVVARHQTTLLRIARQHSLCDDDALDAYQRALEIFVRRVSTVERTTEVAWLKVVTFSDAARPSLPIQSKRQRMAGDTGVPDVA